jgi:hypothetical protein
VAVPGEALAQVTAFCTKRVPKRLQHERKVECTSRGNAVTITESRPLWAGVSEEWVARRVAQLRYDPASSSWSLHWSEGGARWRPLDDVAAVPLAEVLAALDADAHGVFWP